MGTVSSTELVELSLARDSCREGAQWHCGQLCQELLAQDEVVGLDGGGGGDGGLRVRDGRGQGWGVRLPDGPGLLRQEVRLHVRWGQKWHVRSKGIAGGRLGGSEEGGQACCADEEQRGHLLQERPSNLLLLLLLHLQQAREQALAESQAHGEAGTQEDGQHILQLLHGRPLSPVPNLTVIPLS